MAKRTIDHSGRDVQGTMSEDRPKPYSWESLMPDNCVALRVGEKTQQGDLKLSCNDKWIKVVAGLIITGEHGPVCRRKPELFTAILRDKHGRLTADVFVQAGKSYDVDALGRLIEVDKPQAEGQVQS
jgi:hypothetical protein